AMAWVPTASNRLSPEVGSKNQEKCELDTKTVKHSNATATKTQIPSQCLIAGNCSELEIDEATRFASSRDNRDQHQCKRDGQGGVSRRRNGTFERDIAQSGMGCNKGGHCGKGGHAIDPFQPACAIERVDHLLDQQHGLVEAHRAKERPCHADAKKRHPPG